MGCQFDLHSESKTVLKEIMHYKWLQSEKEGFDIGLNRAAEEWIEHYYDNWFSLNAQDFLLKE